MKEFHLNTTVLTKHDGTEIYAPNSSLASKLIHNIRRSGPQSEVIRLKLSSKTSALRIRRLQEAMRKYLENEASRDFFGKDFVIHLHELLDKDTYSVSMTLEHKRNFFDIGRLKARKNRFLWRLKREMDKLEIDHIG